MASTKFLFTVRDMTTDTVVTTYTVPESAVPAEMKAMYASNKTIGWWKHNGIARGLRWTYGQGTMRVDVSQAR